MNRAVTALLLVLLIQCGLVAVMFWPAPPEPQHSKEPPFASFATDAVDEIRIGDASGHEAILLRAADRWLLPDLHNLPADGESVDALLQSLGGATTDWPVAHSAAARQRFQVAEYHYQKRIALLSAGDETATIYLGTAPGFRKVHARNARQDAIYSIVMSGFELPANDDAWLDPRLLQVRAPLRIDSDLYNLYYEDGRWQSATGGTPDAAHVDALTNALRHIEVAGVADEDLQRELAEVEPELVMRVQNLAGDITLNLLAFRGRHYISSSEFPLFFRVSERVFDGLTAIDARRLAGEAEQAEQAEQAEEIDHD